MTQVASICRCGWKSEPFPTPQLDTYEHFCGRCNAPILRWESAQARDRSWENSPFGGVEVDYDKP